MPNAKEKFVSPERKKKIIKLDDLMDPKRPVPEEYKNLILTQEQRRKTGIYADQRFSQHWNLFLRPLEGTKESPRARDFFRKKLRNGLVIDLGGGVDTGGYMRDFCQEFGVNTYINIDMHLGDKKAPFNPLTPTHEETYKSLHEIEVKDDILDFVARMKDNSANFVLNGIDMSAINNRAYHEVLARELARATKQCGIVFGINAEVDMIWRTLREKAPFKDQSLDLAILHSFIYEKK